MIRIVTGDLHLSDNPRDAYRHAFMKNLVKLAKQRKADAVYILGDLTEEKDRHTGWLVNTMVDELAALAEVCRVLILMGNHDYLADPAYAFYTFVHRIPNISWIANPTNIKGELFLPHTRDYEKDWKDIECQDNWDWIFTHQTFQGAKVGPRTLEGVPPTVFAKDASVISGDIHVPQEVGPVTYVGAPYLVDFGDDYVPRVLVLNGKNMESVKCPGVQKRLIEMTAHMESDGPIFEIEHVAGAEQPSAGDVLKVRVDLGIASREDWPSIREAIQGWAVENKYALHSIATTNRNAPKQRTKAAPRARKTDEEILRDYAQQQGLDPSLLKTGLEFL
jgi:hypothetical protein